MISVTCRSPQKDRSLHHLPRMLTLFKDLNYSLRTLRKMPGFTIVALLVLALGIGANTAIFSVVNSVVLRPLPYPNADRLALIWETDLKDGIKREGPSGPNFLDWKEQSQSFDEMALLEVGTGTLTGDGEPEQIIGLRVTTNFLSMLGARTVLGRGFSDGEGEGQARYPVAVLTNGFWKRRFGSDPNVIGQNFLHEQRAVHRDRRAHSGFLAVAADGSLRALAGRATARQEPRGS